MTYNDLEKRLIYKTNIMKIGEKTKNDRVYDIRALNKNIIKSNNSNSEYLNQGMKCATIIFDEDIIGGKL